jgi:hypothetical protein
MHKYPTKKSPASRIAWARKNQNRRGNRLQQPTRAAHHSSRPETFQGRAF